MSNNYNQDEPTLPAYPPMPPQQNPGSQDRLVLGGFQDQPKSGQSRRPYQYQPQQAPVGQPPATPPQGQPQRGPNGEPVSAPNMQQRSSYPQGGPTPAANPSMQRYPYLSGGPNAGARPGRQGGRRPRRGCLIGCLVVLLLACVLGGFTFTTAQRVMAFGTAISTQTPLSTQTGYMGTSDRTNLLVMGYGGGDHDGANLTDSMVVVSMLPQSKHTSLISVPRDLWVQYPPNSGSYTKLNSVYTIASDGGDKRVVGADATAAKIKLVTGLDVKYWLMIDFNGFRELIDAIGGVDVYVPDSFTARYPKNDDPKVDASWITVKFKKGNTHMNGETAIRYSRAREVLDNLAEGTDFARSARQQIIIKAVLSKVKQMSTWPHLFSAMDALQKTIYTNLSLADLTELALKMDLNDPKTARIGLSNQNVLKDGQSDDGQYILEPATSWDDIPVYIKKHLYT